MLTDLDPPAPPPQHWSWKKMTLGFLGFIIVILAGLLFIDQKLEPYDDLLPLRTTISEAPTNGYLLLKERWQAIPELPTAGQHSLTHMIAGKVAWDESLVAKMRAGRETASSDLKTALAAPEFLTPLVLSYDDDSNVYTGWAHQLHRYLSMEVLAHARTGNPATALELLSDLQHLSKRCVEGSGGQYTFVSGTIIQAATTDLTNHLLDLQKLDGDQLKTLAGMWHGDCTAPQAWQSAISNNAAYWRDIIERIKKRRDVPESVKFWQAWLLLKKNQTLNRSHKNARRLISVGFKTFPSKAEAEAAGWFRMEDEGSLLVKLLDPNYVGSQFIKYSSCAPILPSVTDSLVFKPRALRVKIALLRWKAAHSNTLPASLDDLVPEYLPAVPEDPFNGAPLLWDPAAGVIYCVGSDWKPDLPTFESWALWYSDDRESPGLRLTRPPAPPMPAKPKKSPPKKTAAP